MLPASVAIDRFDAKVDQVGLGRDAAPGVVNQPILTLEGISLAFGGVLAIADVDLEVGANLLAIESRARRTRLWGGRTTYRIRRDEGGLRLAYKKVVWGTKINRCPRWAS